jgi:hypothetical protein
MQINGEDALDSRSPERPVKQATGLSDKDIQ